MTAAGWRWYSARNQIE